MPKTRKNLYCPACKAYPHTIREEYGGVPVEYRTWNGTDYGLEYSNLDELPIVQLCNKCSSELVVRET